MANLLLDKNGREMPRSGWIMSSDICNRIHERMERYGLKGADLLVDRMFGLVADAVELQGLPENLLEGEDAD